MLLARSYSHHSLLSALPQIPDLIKNAKEKGYTSIALTDEDSGSGLIEFYEECKKQDIKPVLGATLRIQNLSKEERSFGSDKSFSKIVILAKNEFGYKSLLELISIARTVQELPAYHITFENLQDQYKSKGENFIVLIPTNDHEIGTALRARKKDQVKNIFESYIQKLGAKNLLVELLLKLEKENQTEYSKANSLLIQIAKELNLKLIASPAPRYLEEKDEEVFRVVLAIRNQTRLTDINLTRQFHLPTLSELEELYGQFENVTDTSDLENSIDISIRCDFDKHADDSYFPKFHLPDDQNPGDRLTWETFIGMITNFHPLQKNRAYWIEQYPYQKLPQLKQLAQDLVPDTSKLLGYPKDYWGTKKTVKDYLQRIEYELDIIIKKGYAEYFLVFGDIMTFCRENGIVTNTRGSAAGSIVGYFNSINVLDPLIYNIPFERFLNPFRPSPPDIDGDFADDKRELVIRYITDKYGVPNVSQILTFGTMLPRAGIRDVGRVLGVSYKKCDRLSKLIPVAPQGRKATFNWALETSSELKEVYEQDEESKRIIDIAKRIEGNYRHASCHAAGLIITPTKLTDYAPTQWDTEHKMVVVQYDMKIAEKIGIVKMDILGIRNLAILGNAIELTEKRRNIDIDLLNIDVNDKKAFELLSKGRTMGTFQLSGNTMTRWLVELEPNKVQDLMAMVALYRPGPMASIPEYIARKKDSKKIKYLVPQMEKWMGESYGIFVYQEDLLMTAIELAGYNWGEADVLRKGMGKKIQKVIDEQHFIFVEGAEKNSGLTKAKAEEIWALMVPFGAYGFNKAHSCSYGMVAYWTAYMKAEYTVEFMTAYMTAESSNLDKIAAAIGECKEMGINVLPPDVNKSFDNFTIEDDKTIRYGLGSVKNLGSDVIKFIIKQRDAGGEFSTLEDFIDRMSEFQGFNKRSVEALILSGSLDALGELALESISA